MLCGGLKYDLSEWQWSLYNFRNHRLRVCVVQHRQQPEQALCALMSEPDMGKQDNLLYCCHSLPQWGFLGSVCSFSFEMSLVPVSKDHFLSLCEWVGTSSWRCFRIFIVIMEENLSFALSCPAEQQSSVSGVSVGFGAQFWIACV